MENAFYYVVCVEKSWKFLNIKSNIYACKLVIMVSGKETCTGYLHDVVENIYYKL